MPPTLQQKLLPNILVALFYGLIVVMTSLLLQLEGSSELASVYLGVIGGLAVNLARERSKEKQEHEKLE